ncbi:MAG: NUDIX hydrolase [Kangiellaceae bacterium]|nr:NUDIX hydrolase [Kangiellaceae bacterium]MCW8998982.1 NUDIX hydrolase [Kangiellaceae bacterium]
MDFIHVTVAAIIRRNDRFLLVKEKSSSGNIVYNQPAGHVELNESLISAVKREVKEETGLCFEPTALLGTYLISPAVNGKTYLRFCFVGDVPEDQEPSPMDPDIIDNRWFSSEEIANLPESELRSALVLQCLLDYQKGKRIPLESLVFTGDELHLLSQCRDALSAS